MTTLPPPSFPVRQNVPPGVGISAQLWNNQPAAGTSNGGGMGLQLPTKNPNQGASPAGGSGAGTPNGNGNGVQQSAVAAGKQPARQGSADPESTDKTTNVDTLMDAVGIAGVDLGAEEEGLRAANERQQQSAPMQPGQDRSRKQDFIDGGVLAECVKKIAAAFSLKTLEPDTIPFIALATRQRLMSLIDASIQARDHRLNASHHRPPPFTTGKRKRDDDEDDDDEFEEVNPEKEKEKEPAWDQVVYDDPEKILAMLERVEREEERRKRRERVLRDQKEQEERDMQEAIKAAEAAQRELDGDTSGGNTGDRLLMGGGESGVGTPKEDGEKKPKKPKKKKEGAAALAKSMPEDVKKRLTDQVAMRQLGGRSFSWLNAGGASSSGFSTPSGGGLPKPKFAPATALPPPTFASPAPGPSSSNAIADPSTPTPSSAFPPALSRLNVPPLHDANRQARDAEEWAKNHHLVELADLVYAMEEERGMGNGKGSGRNSVLRARAGLNLAAIAAREKKAKLQS